MLPNQGELCTLWLPKLTACSGAQTSYWVQKVQTLVEMALVIFCMVQLEFIMHALSFTYMIITYIIFYSIIESFLYPFAYYRLFT